MINWIYITKSSIVVKNGFKNTMKHNWTNYFIYNHELLQEGGEYLRRGQNQGPQEMRRVRSPRRGEIPGVV